MNIHLLNLIKLFLRGYGHENFFFIIENFFIIDFPTIPIK